MPESDMLSNENLKKIAAVAGPCATAVFARASNLTKVVRQVEAELQERYPETDVKAFIAPLTTASSNGSAPPEAASGVILRSSEVFHQFWSRKPLRESVVVGDEFQIRPLLALASHIDQFYILALSQKNTRLLRCTGTTSEEVAFPTGVPKSLDEANQFRKPDHTLDNRASGGPSTGSMKGVMFGTSTDHDHKDEYLQHFFAALDRGLQPVLREDNAPLVVTAVEHELALYRSVNTYAGTVEPGIHGAPDGLKGGEMHRRALELLESTMPDQAHHALEHFDKLVGTGHASTRVQEIILAAFEGRVSSLFLQENAQYEGDFDEIRQKVKPHGRGADKHDLVNATAIQTLVHGGQVSCLAGNKMPNGVPICAIFRYAVPEVQSQPAPEAMSA